MIETRFLDLCKKYLEKIEKGQAEKFKEAGKIIGDRLMENELIHVIGTGGHTCIPMYEMFYRAGGFVPINAVLDVSLTVHTGATRAMRVERTPGYMRSIVDYFKIKTGDVVIIINNIGVNAATIDAALACKEHGAITIGIAGSPWQTAIPMDHYTRHPSRKNLMDIVDIFIDDYNPVGDTVITLDGFDRSLAGISTITDCYIVHRIEIEAAKYMLSKDFTPPVWMSANVPGGDEANKKYEKEYYNRVKYL